MSHCLLNRVVVSGAGVAWVVMQGFASALPVQEDAKDARIEKHGDLKPVPAVSHQEPWFEELRTARRMGDGETIQRIQGTRRQSVFGMGEAASGTVLHRSTTVGGSGMPSGRSGGPGVDFSGGSSAPQGGGDNDFGSDKHVRGGSAESAESNQAMASDSLGNLYVAWQDDFFDKDYIQVYTSANDGESWVAFGYVLDNLADLEQPSLAVGQGVNGDVLLLAYITDDGGMPVPEVATAPLSSSSFTVSSVPVWPWEGYAKPVIATDAIQFSGWYGYLTCEGIYDSGLDNINTCTWRSIDGGATWGNEAVPYGNLDAYAWIDPDIATGTTMERVFLVTYLEDDLDVYTSTSDDFALNWNAPVIAASLSLIPGAPVDPEIAPAVLHDNVMIACTKNDGSGSDDVGYTYSQDAGATWSTFWTLPGYRVHDDYAVALSANEGGANWHLAYTSGQDGSVHYNCRPQDLSSLWQSESFIIDDLGTAGTWAGFSKKGIASNWSTDVATVAWADARDGILFDFDTYVDFVGNQGLMVDRRLVGPNEEVTINLRLTGGPENAGRFYALFGSVSGTSPGTPLPGGYVTLPINWDIFTVYTIKWGPPNFRRFHGDLDANGEATAEFYLPANAGLPGGLDFYFAYALSSPWDFASNPVAVKVSF